MEATRINLLQDLKPYQGNKRLLVKYQDTNDIVKALQAAHVKNAADYDKICSKFWNGNKKTLLKKLFNFCKRNIRYEIESDQNQTIKTPAAIIAQGKGDCKHYASFINGIISACNRKYGCGIDNYFRFSGYKIGATEPQHVFAVVKNADGNEIWIDPVLENFDEHKETTYQTDKKANNMLHSVSGFGEYAEIGRGGSGRRKLKRFLQNAGESVQDAAKKVSRTLKAGALAPQRNAFLVLLKLNAFQFAVKLAKLYKSPGGAHKVTQFWNKLGGKDSALKNAINAGIKHYRNRRRVKMDLISGIAYDEQILKQEGIGSGVAAAIAAATPIIVACIELLKANNIPASATGDPEAGNAPIITDEESYEVEEAVNGCIGAVVRKHRAIKKTKAAVKNVLTAADNVRKALKLPKSKSATAVDTLLSAKKYPTQSLAPDAVTAIQQLQAHLTNPTLTAEQQANRDRKKGILDATLKPDTSIKILQSAPLTPQQLADQRANKAKILQQTLIAPTTSTATTTQTPEQLAANAAAAYAALQQGASPLVRYAASAAQNDEETAPEDDKRQNMTADEVTEATTSAGLTNKQLGIGLGIAAAIYLITKKSKH